MVGAVPVTVTVTVVADLVTATLLPLSELLLLSRMVCPARVPSASPASLKRAWKYAVEAALWAMSRAWNHSAP